MSGICGIVRFDGAPCGKAELERMATAAAHRGPDGVEYQMQAGAGIGFLALKLRPEEQQERQPLVDGKTGVVLAADLRLDNREELEAALGPVGPGVMSDAQLLLAAYLRWGGGVAERLLGDFAYVVWDPRERVLRLARDAMGMRPLYWRREPHRVLFGSEVKQMLAAEGVPRAVDEVSVAAHLAGMHAPLERSFWEGVAQVVPGEEVRIDEAGARRRRFWDIDPGRRERYRDERQYQERFRELFVEAVRCRLRGVKSVGISLSGGIDSGSIASVWGWLRERGELAGGTELRAYTWAFNELKQCDERDNAKRVAGRYGIELVEVSADDAWPLSGYPDHGPDLDEPFIFYYQELMERVILTAKADGMRLLLTGERGDAVVDHWVYDYPGLFLNLRWADLFREFGAHGAAMGISRVDMMKRYVARPLFHRLLGRVENVRNRRTTWPAYMRSTLTDRINVASLEAKAFPSGPFCERPCAQRFTLIFSSMSGRRIGLLETYQSHHGIAHADPWSDRRLAEFVIGIPQWTVHRYGDYKRLARRSLHGILPEAHALAADSGSKANPTDFFELAMRKLASPVVRNLLTDTRAASKGWVEDSCLRSDYEASVEGIPMKYDLWWFLTMEMWLRRHSL